MTSVMNPALETLLWPFAQGRLTRPARTLFLMAEAHPDLAGWTGLECYQPWKPAHDALKAMGVAVAGDAVPDGPFDLVMLLGTKARDENLGLMARAYDALKPGGVFLMAMTNGAGAGRYEKTLAAAAGAVNSLSKHKARAFWAIKEARLNAGWLDAWRAAGAPRAVAGSPFQATPGLFSADRLDAGTLALLGHLPHDLQGEIADFGCGWGLIAAWVLENANPTRLDLYDADARALDAARGNIAALRPAVARRFLWADASQPVADRYDAIVTNPPFHAGQETQTSLGQAVLRNAARALKPGGRVFIVANRHLPYESVLQQEGLGWSRLAEEEGYKILMGQRP